ncbi:MAG: hypothetical protein ACTSR2_00435 [Candidatus Hodarchaeales archaeon]
MNRLIKLLLKLRFIKIKKEIGYRLPSGKFVSVMDYNEAGLWIYYLMGKYAGKTLGDAIAEQVLEIKRPFENLPNCWVIYEK